MKWAQLLTFGGAGCDADLEVFLLSLGFAILY